MPTSRLVRKIFRWTSEIADRGKVNWVSRTRNLIEKLHIENQLEGALTVNKMKDVLWNALANHYEEKWRDSVWDAGALGSESGGKLVLYRQLKTSPELEPYARAHYSCCCQKGPGWFAGPVASPSKSNWEGSRVPKHHTTNEPARCVVKPRRTRLGRIILE